VIERSMALARSESDIDPGRVGSATAYHGHGRRTDCEFPNVEAPAGPVPNLCSFIDELEKR